MLKCCFCAPLYGIICTSITVGSFSIKSEHAFTCMFTCLFSMTIHSELSNTVYYVALRKLLSLDRFIFKSFSFHNFAVLPLLHTKLIFTNLPLIGNRQSFLFLFESIFCRRCPFFSHSTDSLRNRNRHIHRLFKFSIIRVIACDSL